MEGTARQCILILLAMLTASDAIALLLPGVRAELMLWPRKVSPNLVLIRAQGSNSDSRPSVSQAQFDSWKGRKQKYFDGFAFYRVTREAVEPVDEQGGGRTARQNYWGVAARQFTTICLRCWVYLYALHSLRGLLTRIYPR